MSLACFFLIPIPSGHLVRSLERIANTLLRDSFIAFNSAVQLTVMGLALIAGSLIIGRDVTGQVELYGLAGLECPVVNLLLGWAL